MQETWIQSTCCGATKPMHHNYWSPRTLEPGLCKRRSHCDEKPTHINYRAVPAHRNQRKLVHSNEDPAQLKIHKLVKLKKKTTKKKNIAQKIVNPKEYHKISAEFLKKCISTLLNINHRIYKYSSVLQSQHEYWKHDSLLQQNLNFSCYRLAIITRKTMSIYIKIDQLDSLPRSLSK